MDFHFYLVHPDVDGEGIPQDNQQAVYWFTKAAEMGYVPAPYNLGVMYSQGDGVNKNFGEAIYEIPNDRKNILRPGRSFILWQV